MCKLTSHPSATRHLLTTQPKPRKPPPPSPSAIQVAQASGFQDTAPTRPASPGPSSSDDDAVIIATSWELAKPLNAAAPSFSPPLPPPRAPKAIRDAQLAASKQALSFPPGDAAPPARSKADKQRAKRRARAVRIRERHALVVEGPEPKDAGEAQRWAEGAAVVALRKNAKNHARNQRHKAKLVADRAAAGEGREREGERGEEKEGESAEALGSATSSREEGMELSGSG